MKTFVKVMAILSAIYSSVLAVENPAIKWNELRHQPEVKKPAPSAKPTQERINACIEQVHQWAALAFGGVESNQFAGEGKKPGVPFSFVYDDRPSSEFLSRWHYAATKPEPFASRGSNRGTRRLITHQDRETGLRIECEVKTYPDAAVVEWVCFLSNTGEKDTPIIKDFQALDVKNLTRSGKEDTVRFRWSNGDGQGEASYLPCDEVLENGKNRDFRSDLPSLPYLPFFNLQTDGRGWIVGLGWTGSWYATFSRQDDGQVGIKASLQNTHFRLKPGEKVRLPRIVLLHWAGDEMIHGHNQWRIDIFRQDFFPSPPADTKPDRQGIRAMKYYENLYKLWAELKRRNPGLLIDNCSCGGTRIDMETSSLAFVLWRSDFNDMPQGLKGNTHWPYMAMAEQVMVSGLSLYVPVHNGPTWEMRPYSFRSAMTSGIVIYDNILQEDFSDTQARAGIAELKEIRPYFRGDLYPLLKLTTSQRDWYAYQLDRSDLGEGCVLFFRRPDSPYAMSMVHLYNIDLAARYQVSLTGETFEQANWKTLSGQELASLEIQIAEQPGSVLVRYRKVK